MGRRTAKLVFLAALASSGLPGAELPRGRVLERVVCAGNLSQSYALYLPPAYSPEHAWPIMYCLDPLARGVVPVERFAHAAGLAGWIVAGSNNSRNGPVEVPREAIQWLVRDTHARFAIDDSRMFAAGFSGGARLALSWASGGQLSGVVACGAGFGAPAIPKVTPLRVYATVGVDDFNYDEVYAMSRELSRRGIPQRFAEFPGGHDWLPQALTGPAIDFLSGRLESEPPPVSAGQKKAAERYASLTDELQRGSRNAQSALIGRLRRNADLPEDGVERRVARRVLIGTFIGSMEQGADLLSEKKYSEAAQAWDLAVLAQPDNAEAYYDLAIAQAGAHDERRALDAIELAVAHGFSDLDRIEREPLFDRVRNRPRFSAAISSMKK